MLKHTIDQLPSIIADASKEIEKLKPVDQRRLVLLGRPKVEHRYIEDVRRIRKAMNELGFDASDEDVGWAYEEYSENEMSAGWIVLDYWKTDEGAAKAAMRYLEQNAGAMARGLAAPDADNTTEIDG